MIQEETSLITQAEKAAVSAEVEDINNAQRDELLVKNLNTINP